MKTRLTTFCILLISISLHAQESNNQKRSNKIGISYSSFGETSIARKEDLIGEGSYDDEQFFTIGVNYLTSINKWLNFETGLEYSKHRIVVSPSFIPGNDNSSHKENLSLLCIPLTLKAEFLKFFFVNGGCFLDLNMTQSSPIDDQTGIGGLFGIGVKYDFDFGGSLFINPYSKFHALVPFSSGDNQQKLTESGIRIGLTYTLNRNK